MASFPVCDGTLSYSLGAPSCSGSWVSVVYQSPFDVSQIDPVAVVNAVGAGFIVGGVPFLTVLLARIVLSSIFTGYKK
jgi:hypothetical protein